MTNLTPSLGPADWSVACRDTALKLCPEFLLGLSVTALNGREAFEIALLG